MYFKSAIVRSKTRFLSRIFFPRSVLQRPSTRPGMARECVSPKHHPAQYCSTQHSIISEKQCPAKVKKGSSRGGERKSDTLEGANLLGRLLYLYYEYLNREFSLWKGGYFIWSPSKQNTQWPHCSERGCWLSDFIWRGGTPFCRGSTVPHIPRPRLRAPHDAVWEDEFLRGPSDDELHQQPPSCGGLRRYAAWGPLCRFLGRLPFLNVPQLRHETICKGGEWDPFTF